MGALLSLPLLAVPSMGTVSLVFHASKSRLTTGTACEFWRILLRSDSMFGLVYSVRCLQKQHGNSYRICLHSLNQLDSLLVDAYAVGSQETRAPNPGLHEHHLSRKAVLRLCRCAACELCSRSLPLNSRDPSHRRQILQRWPSFCPERLLGAQSDHLASLCGHDLLHPRNLLPGLGRLFCPHRSNAVCSPRSDTPGRSRPHLGRVLP